MPKRPKFRGKIAVFIDAPALYAMEIEMHRMLDYRRLFDYLVNDYTLIPDGFIYYDKPRPSKAHDFYRSLGFNVKTTSSRDEDVDDELVREIMDRSNEADIVILVGGDHVYYEALKQADEADKITVIVCLPEMLSSIYDSITKLVFIDLWELENLIDERRTEGKFGVWEEIEYMLSDEPGMNWPEEET
jgi:uncharacterized LabA/DUF88 family protein